MDRWARLVLIALVMLGGTRLGMAAEVRVAVASNFVPTLNVLARNFESGTEDRLLISAGSTGKLYAQIKHGAPFELFLAADSARPLLLEREGLAVAQTRFTYALGRLALWSARPDMIDGTDAALGKGDFRHIALANPRIAPYGAAAARALEELGLWEAVRSRIVYGENVAQAFSFVSTGNAELGFVALAQVIGLEDQHQGSSWIVPQGLHLPIEQQAVLLSRGRDNAAALRFLSYLRSADARSIIERSGYDVE